jgi:hypothetical protein
VHTLEAVAVLSLLAHDVEDGVDELGALGVVALGPVVPGAGLAVDEVVGAEDAAEGAGADGFHGAGLQVHEHGAGHIAATPSLVVVDVDPLELELLRGGPRVAARGVDAVLAADHLPELGADLVAALAALDVQDLPHLARPAHPSLARRAAILDGGGGLWREARTWERSSERGGGRGRSGWDGGRRAGRSVILASWPPRFGGGERGLGPPVCLCRLSSPPSVVQDQVYIYSFRCCCCCLPVSIPFHAFRQVKAVIQFIIVEPWTRCVVQDWDVDMVSGGGARQRWAVLMVLQPRLTFTLLAMVTFHS